MRTLRRTAAITSAALLTISLGGCALIEGPKQSACDALYAQIDGVTEPLTSAAGGTALSAKDLEVLLDELETQNPEAFAEVRDGNFSSLLDNPDVDIQALEEATGNSQLSEFMTPQNLGALDGAGASIMNTIDQIRSVCGS